MRYVFAILLAGLAAYGVVQLNQLEPGNYVKIYAGVYYWELTIAGFLVAIGLTVILLYIALRLFRNVWKSAAWFKRWRTERNREQAAASLGEGYLSLIKGDWRQAEKRLLSGSSSSRVPYVNYLAAAQAAQKQNKLSKRNEYLESALKAAPSEKFAIALTRATLHLESGELAAAQEILSKHEDKGRKNGQYLGLLMQTYHRQGDWQSVLGLMKAAKKYDALPSVELDGIYQQANAASIHDADSSEGAWKELPRTERKNVDNQFAYARRLLDENKHQEAEKLLKRSLNSQLSEKLLSLYAQIKTDKPKVLRKNVESWINKHPEHSQLLFLAGKFALQEGNTELARQYLQRSIEIDRLPAAYALLGQSYEANSESGRAFESYRAGMQQFISK